MKAQHTPGPWSFGEYTDGNVEPHVDMIMVTAPKSKNYGQEICSFPLKGKAKANAALIAAAPDMLEALQALTEDFANVCTLANDDFRTWGTYTTALEILAKAKGATP